MRREEDELVVVVSDEGSGFKMDQGQGPSQQGGFGRRGIRQRLDFLGGRLELEASPGSGGQATLIVPLTKHGHRAAGASLKLETS